ncbi:MAG TPA: hypothetical protein VK939_14525 [Longimicrobiales bacterium]|nr:hypothetical protein [Longimicrobiales bacterium]
MSRAFVKEEGSDDVPRRHFALPETWDPGYDAAAALALLEAARDGETHLAEEATGYRWGEPQLHPHVQRLLDKELAQQEPLQDDRFITLARRFLRVSAED